MSKKLFEQMCELQEKKVFGLARKLVPYITKEDVLQPNDFPELENNPIFRYEEGILEGLRSALTAFVACKEYD